jgi:hypothetical protein
MPSDPACRASARLGCLLDRRCVVCPALRASPGPSPALNSARPSAQPGPSPATRLANSVRLGPGRPAPPCSRSPSSPAQRGLACVQNPVSRQRGPVQLPPDPVQTPPGPGSAGWPGRASPPGPSPAGPGSGSLALSRPWPGSAWLRLLVRRGSLSRGSRHRGSRSANPAVRLRRFQDCCCALAACCADRDQASARALLVEEFGQGCHYAAAGRGERVACCQGRAVHVQLRAVDRA